jgi:hypothetical protein
MGKSKRNPIRYVGMDIHKEMVASCIVDERGKVVQRQRCRCTREELEQFGRRYLQPSDKIALEATTNTWEIVGILKAFVTEVVVSNPLKTKAIAEAKIKTDKVDAEVLAQRYRKGFTAWRHRCYESGAPAIRGCPAAGSTPTRRLPAVRRERRSDRGSNQSASMRFRGPSTNA